MYNMDKPPEPLMILNSLLTLFCSASALEDMKLKKEWQLMYDVLPDVVHEQPITETTTSKTATRNSFIEPGNFIAVYTALTKTHEKNSKDSKCKNKV